MAVGSVEKRRSKKSTIDCQKAWRSLTDQRQSAS